MVKEKEAKESFEAQLDHAGIDQIIHAGNDQTTKILSFQWSQSGRA